MTSSESEVRGLVDHLFRRSAGQMVAALTRALGAENLDLAEEVVQDALVRALQVWPHRGVPASPEAWLQRTARNRAIDVLRRRENLRGKLESVAGMPWEEGAEQEAAPALDGAVADAELAMIFMCCHPALPHESQLALTLKTVGGLSVDEIAGALLARKPTVAQRLVRAKRLIAERNIALELPPTGELPARLDAVLKVLYLMFNEGYSAHHGARLVRRDLCGEAIRLAELVAAHQVTGRPEAHALLALMLFQASHNRARQDADGALLLLADQERCLWDAELIARGFRALDRSASGDRITPYHVQASIAACHAAAPSWERTDWLRILDLYDQLVEMEPTPVTRLNRAVAVAMVRGPRAGIAAVEAIATDPGLKRYYLLPATFGELWRRAGVPLRAATYYSRAIELPCTEPERRFLEKKLAECRPPGSGPS